MVNKYKPGPEEWLKILWENNVAAFACAGYELHPHGTPSQNNVLDARNLSGLDYELRSGKYLPWLGSNFALSLLVSKNNDGSGVYEGDWDLYRDEPWLNTVPYALLGLDMDCPRSKGNVNCIAKKMENFRDDWSLLETEQSYHLICHHLMPPQNLPFHLGRMLKMFANTTDNISENFFTRAGNCLEKCWNDWTAIRWVVGTIFTNVRHWDEVSGIKVHTFPDAKWVGHTLVELDRFLNEPRYCVKSGFGYLRAGPKSTNKSIPTLKAEKKGTDVVVYEVR